MILPVGLALGLATALWHGGFYTSGQRVFVLGALITGAAALPTLRPKIALPVLAGLGLVAAANVVALWRSPDGEVTPVLVAGALVVFGAAVAARPELVAVPMLVCIAGVTATASVAGIIGVLTHRLPVAERLGGLWRAGGTFEYPPALGLACVCGLAAALALHGGGWIDRVQVLVLGVLLVAGIAASYDRTSAVEAVLVVALFAWRVPQMRRTALIAAGAIGVTGAAALAVGLSHPGGLGIALGHGPLSSRTGILSDAWRGFRHRPWAGYGPGRFADLYAGSADPTRTNLAHNMVLEQGVEAGAAAALGALVVLISGLVGCARRLRSRAPLELGWALIGAAVLLSGLYDFTWSYPPIALIGVAAAVLSQAAIPAGTSPAGSRAP